MAAEKPTIEQLAAKVEALENTIKQVRGEIDAIAQSIGNGNAPINAAIKVLTDKIAALTANGNTGNGNFTVANNAPKVTAPSEITVDGKNYRIAPKFVAQNRVPTAAGFKTLTELDLTNETTAQSILSYHQANPALGILL